MSSLSSTFSFSPRRARTGFTLVELGVVLMVIGILVGGVLMGEELIEKARLTRTIKQAIVYKTAIRTFKNTYSTLPGDMFSPGTRLAGCTGDCATSGNADRVIGADSAQGTQSIYDLGTATENANVWRHLAVANLIQYEQADGTNAFVPRSPLRGIFYIAHMTQAAGDPNYRAYNGHYLVVQRSIPHHTRSPQEDPYNLYPRQAMEIDRKMDDGLPYSGEVMAAVHASNVADCITGTNYLERGEKIACNLIIRMID